VQTAIPDALRRAREQADELLVAALFDAKRRSPGDRAQLLWPKDLAQLSESWPQPTEAMAQLTDELVTEAVQGVRRASVDLGVGTFRTGIPMYAVANMRSSQKGERLPEFAPLVTACLDDTVVGWMALFLARAHSPFARNRPRGIPRDVYRGIYELELMTRANQFLVTESLLWKEARAGGFSGTVPYPVRYETARYLWSPSIAGTAFCLRCGEAVNYLRKGRTSGPRPRSVPLCDPCLRSKSIRWPAHALMPNQSGTWWLRCKHPACATAFSGSGNRDYCDKHRRSVDRSMSGKVRL
jgi:hypothetical protein